MNPKPASKSIITLGGAPTALGALTAKQARAVQALMEAPNTAQAAAQAGCHQRTLTGWMRQPSFQAALAEARREVMRSTLGRLQTASGKALEVLTKTLEDPNVFARLQASQTILGASLKVAAAEELEARLAVVEAQLARRVTPTTTDDGLN